MRNILRDGDLDIGALLAFHRSVFGDARMDATSPLEIMVERRAANQTALEELLKLPTAENRNLDETESPKFDSLVEEIRKQDERITELRDLAKREAAEAAARVEAGAGHEDRAHVTDPPVYARGLVETSYFRDLFRVRYEGDVEAGERLRRNDKARADELSKRGDKLDAAEQRAMGNTGAAGGSGGEFAPPLWLIEDFIAYARPGRKFADSLNPRPLPTGISSVNIPAVTAGTTTAIQTTQNSALSSTDLTTSSVSSNIATIGGKNVVSVQLLSQSGIPFDEVLLQDLAASYAQQFDLQVISGSGSSGQLLGVNTYFTASGTANVTYTQATPAVGGAGGLYSKIFNAASNVETSRFMPPDTIWMHPRRWNWILSSSDTTNRPLVNPSATAMNVVAQSNGVGNAQGIVGQIGSLDVITDANIPTTVNSTQDVVLVGLRSDMRLWESALQTETFTATYADSAGVLFRVLAFSAAIPKRYTTSVSVISGTGLAAPSF